jgi:hypothetical protein
VTSGATRKDRFSYNPLLLLLQRRPPLVASSLFYSMKAIDHPIVPASQLSYGRLNEPMSFPDIF